MRTNTKKNRPKAKKSRSLKVRPDGRVLPMKMKVKKGDKVVIMTGKDKGKQGEVLVVLPKENRVVVDGIALHKRHLRKSGRTQSGRIVERPSAIHASNVMLLDPESKKPSRVGRAKEAGKTVRVAKKSKTTLK